MFEGYCDAFDIKLSFRFVDLVSEKGASPLYVPSVLVLGTRTQRDAMPSQVGIRCLRDDDPTLLVDIELLHGSMNADPNFINGIYQSPFFLVWNQLAGVEELQRPTPVVESGGMHVASWLYSESRAVVGCRSMGHAQCRRPVLLAQVACRRQLLDAHAYQRPLAAH